MSDKIENKEGEEVIKNPPTDETNETPTDETNETPTDETNETPTDETNETPTDETNETPTDEKKAPVNIREKIAAKKKETASYTINKVKKEVGESKVIPKAKTVKEINEKPKEGVKPKEGTEKEKEQKGNPKASAKMAAMGVEVLSSRVSSLISGREVDEYKSTPADLKQLNEAFAEYFEAMGISFNPFWVFIGVVAMIIGGKLWRAIGHRREDKKKEIATMQQKTEAKKTLEKSSLDIKKSLVEFGAICDYSDFVEKYDERTKFALFTEGSAKGYYMFSKLGEMKRFSVSKDEHKKEQDSKPSAFVKECYEKLKPFYKDQKSIAKEVGLIMRKIKRKADKNL